MLIHWISNISASKFKFPANYSKIVLYFIDPVLQNGALLSFSQQMQIRIINRLLFCTLTILAIGDPAAADTTPSIAHPPDAAYAKSPRDQQISEPKESDIPPLIIDPAVYDEPSNTGWQLYIDNDIFISPDIDRDYTGGFGLALTGLRAREWVFSLDRWLDSIDGLTGFQSLQLAEGGFSRHALEFGIILFTPEDITVSEARPNDHPYASLLFMANSQQAIFPEKKWALLSALTVGFIGLDFAGEFQAAIHDLTGSEEPAGWDNQISSGGEITGRYTVAGQKNLLSHYGGFSYELSGGIEGNVGITTDLNANISMRFGKLRSPWWSFNPHQSDYINLGQTLTSRIDERVLPAELFGWAGLKARYRIYNGFLQGQFRDSAVEFESDEIEDIIYEGWLGITKTWKSGFGLSFVIRGRTNEIKKPIGRNPIWSGFVLSFKG